MNEYERAFEQITMRMLYRGSMIKSKSYKVIKELVERATPKMVLKKYKRCPGCTAMGMSRAFDYCPNCGQALDWSDEE